MDTLRKLGAIGIACFVALALSLSAVATTSVGSFEIDGNRADDSGPGDLILDWDSPPPNVTKFNDASGQGDDIFGIGSKELEPGGWRCVTGSAPGKDDIVNGEVAFRTLKSKQHLYVDFQRAATNGDAHMDYEFNQSREPNPACPALPKRTPGDVLIAFDTDNGGKAIVVRAFRWQGNAVSGSFVELQLGSKGVLWDGAVNIPNTIPGLEPGAFGEAALNLTDTIGQIGCAIFSTVYMKTRASTSITAELKDRTAALPVNFAIDRPDLANASGGALGAHVRSTLLGIDQTLVPVSSRQSGVGSRSAQDELLNMVVPSDGSLLRADVVRGSARSTVTATPAEAVHTSTAETANVKILNGLVTASAVRAVATARANGSSSSFSSLGSAFKDLAVVPGNQTLEIVVAHADAHADFPQTVRCPGVPNQDVSGHAFIGSEATSPAEVPAMVGFVSIPPTGGQDHQDLDEARLSGLTAGASVSDSSGDLAATASTASSYAQAAGVCALPSASGCTVGADLVHSVSNSTANGSGAASNDGDTKLLGVTVPGQVIPVEPAPNTRIEIPGVGFVILNEQFCDNGAALAGHCANGTGHAGLTVRAIHVFVTIPSNPLGLKTGEIVVAEAHSDATFRP